MTKLIFLFILLLFIVIVFVGISLITKNRPGPQASTTRYVPLTTSYSTTITNPPMGLNIIYVPFRNPGLQNSDSFQISLTDPTSTLASLNFSGANLGDPTDLRFQFAPQSIISPLRLVLTPKSQSTPDLLVGVDATGSLAYRTYFRPASVLTRLQTDVTALISRLVVDWPFLVVWALTLGLVVRGIYN